MCSQMPLLSPMLSMVKVVDPSISMMWPVLELRPTSYYVGMILLQQTVATVRMQEFSVKLTVSSRTKSTFNLGK